jgi:hypothetical protein
MMGIISTIIEGIFLFISIIVLSIFIMVMCNIKKLNINSLFMIILLTCAMGSLYYILYWIFIA